MRVVVSREASGACTPARRAGAHSPAGRCCMCAQSSGNPPSSHTFGLRFRAGA